jgi:hypothetical protein
MNVNKFSDKMMSRFFHKVDNVVWDMMTGNLGVKTSSGVMSYDTEEDQVVNNVFDDFSMQVPAFAQSTPVDSLQVGDLIYTNSDRVKGWITKVEEVTKTVKDGEDEVEVKTKKFRLISPSGTESNWKPPKVSMLGFESGVMVLRSLLTMLPGGESGLGNMQNMLLPMMMMGDGIDDKMMQLVLFSQLGTNGTGNSGGNNMLQTMMMIKMMEGNKEGRGYFD